MAITAFTSPTAPLWPLGKIIVAAAGTVVQLNNNVGAQTQRPSSAPTNEGRMLKIMAGSSNTGAIYLLRNVSGQVISAAGTPNFVVDVIYPGQSTPIHPIGFSYSINPDQYCIDADTSGNFCYATLYIG